MIKKPSVFGDDNSSDEDEQVCTRVMHISVLHVYTS